MKSTKRKSTRTKAEPLFVRRAKRAMLRAAENVRKENRAFNLPLIVWENDKLVEKSAWINSVIRTLGAIVMKPVVNDRDEIEIGHKMSITLSGDHRVVDGAVAAEYMGALRNRLPCYTIRTDIMV